MKNNDFWKNFIMAMVAVVAAFISDNQAEGVNIGVLIVTVVGSSLIYFCKNLIAPSTSTGKSLNIRDYVSGFGLALGTAFVNGAATFFIDGDISWNSLWKVGVSVAIGYFGKTFKSNIGKLK